MIDPLFFTSGSLFTLDYLAEAIADTPEYRSVDVAALRAQLDAITAAFPQSHLTNESQTEDDFIWPVLAAIGWHDSLRQQNLTVTGRDDVPDGILFQDTAKKAAANAETQQWKRYGHGLVVLESKRWARPLDRSSGRDEAMAPSTQMLRYLRRIDDLTHGRLRWGILSNGVKWRLYWAGAGSVSEEFLEINLARVLGLDETGDPDLFVSAEERDHWLSVFAVMFGRTSFIREVGNKPTFHERARSAAAYYEKRVADSLSGLVFDQVFPSLANAIAVAASEASLEDVRNAALVLLYRLLFLLYAEDRALLPVANSRYDDYALRRLRDEVSRRIGEGDVFSASASRIWSHIADLSRIIDGGDASVGIPPYNGGLFSKEAASGLLEKVRIPDSVMAPALDALSHERTDSYVRYINYRDLSVQQLGSIYERLLEFELVSSGGRIEVRPNLFARKNTGSYYTPDELVRLILDETLAPLIDEKLEAFRLRLEGLSQNDADDSRRRALREVDPATAILGLRVCDPAMGSGHFLVSLVDILADHVLDAVAEVTTLALEQGYQSPLVVEIEKIRDTILTNAKAGGWLIDEAQLDDRHIVRRMVLKRCVYGVDKNPMAVELAKVALWLHTFTVGAPLSFIDHHLRAGDSLFGLWVRDGINKAAQRGGGELLYAKALREAQSAASAMQVIERLVDVEIGEAHKSADTYFGVRAQVAPLDGFLSLLNAIDWLNLREPADKMAVRAWLDGIFGNPIDIAEGRTEPIVERGSQGEGARFADILANARALIDDERFLNWQVAFPGVWDNWASNAREGGFDAVVGNPPWDRIKLQQVEWFGARREDIALAQRASDRARLIKALKDADDPLYSAYEKADLRAAETARIARTSGHYPLLSRGDINLYSLFVERAHSLVKPGGIVGLLTPSGIASDFSASAFFEQVATGGHLKSLYDFENRRTEYGLEPFFPDVDGRFKFCLMVSSPGRTFAAAHCGFFLHSVDEIGDPKRAFPITAADFSRVNPNTGTAPIFRSRRDMALTTAIYERLPVLVNRSSSEPLSTWPIRYVRMFDMTNDSHLFRTRAELEGNEAAWNIGGNLFESAAGRWVPLYEGKMVQAFDHRAASIVVNEANMKRPAQPVETTLEQHQDPTWLPNPQFWVLESNVSPKGRWHLGMKHVTSPTNVRSMIAAIVPESGAGNSLPIIDVGGEAAAAALVLTNLNSVPFDYVLRQKVQGQNLNWFIVEQLPFVPPSKYDLPFGPKSAAQIVQEAVLELTYTAEDMAAFARDMGHLDSEDLPNPPFIWNEDRRVRLRAKLDALYFILYGLFDPADPIQSRDDISYIYSTFPILEREDRARWSSYRSRELCLAWINALLAGQPDAEVEV